MKKLIYVFALLYLITACENDDNKGISFKDVTIEMGSASANDVYYSLANGEVSTITRSDWDIAFSVPLQTATILINEGAGVELYCVGDTNDWEVVDANTINGIEPRYNDESAWDKGAFNVNASGFPNYGWGTYHAGNPDHNVGGDSLYVIKLTDGSFRKFMVRAKVGTTSANIIRFAYLDGSEETIHQISTAAYVNQKNFIHYSIVDETVIEAEPDGDTWDLLFTRYLILAPSGPGTFMNYPVTGVLNNPDVVIAKALGAPENLTPPTYYTNTPNTIGSNWKAVNQQTMEITIVDSVSYIIQSVDGKTYQLYFTEYGGLNAGTIDFRVREVE
jgi:hypothetical protein